MRYPRALVGLEKWFHVLSRKRIMLKVNIHCQRCKSNVFKAVAKLRGIDKVSVDSEKGMVTVVGDVDPVLLTKKIRKTGKVAEIISVGPAKEPKSPECSPGKPLPPCCKNCQLVAVSYTSYDGGYPIHFPMAVTAPQVGRQEKGDTVQLRSIPLLGFDNTWEWRILKLGGLVIIFVDIELVFDMPERLSWLGISWSTIHQPQQLCASGTVMSDSLYWAELSAGVKFGLQFGSA
ncbi:hypothetical protein RJ639_038912 [Escallonia herrerae]|uniref:HMA domain-containing protein n=1 Tax=Escallonia herrerae TaxID=1293975 RepID=A0AA88WP02_9ASTE|nr:hypothetical protein RJ639_038912 [Escallonia herrerae]